MTNMSTDRQYTIYSSHRTPTTTTTTTTTSNKCFNNKKHSNIREDFARLRTVTPTHHRTTSSPNSQQQQQQQQQNCKRQEQALTRKTLFHSDDSDEDDDDDDFFMMRIVHGSCQDYFIRGDPMLSSSNNSSNTIAPKRHFCRSDLMLGCQGSLSDQLDLFTHCRQPLSFLSIFHEHEHSEEIGVEALHAGAYVLDRYCEYCGSEDTDRCSADCSRPKLYFQKKRPPFEKPDPSKWDPITDHYITPSPDVNLIQSPIQDETNSKRPISPSIISSRAKAWVTELLHPTPNLRPTPKSFS